jgi:hypothetical protein
MPQTISIQRGSVTYTAAGNTTANQTTLFTNTSSGFGTRVIINYLVVQNASVQGSGFQYTSATASGSLAAVSPGTSGTIIGGMFASSSIQAMAMPIMDAGQAIGAGGTISAVTAPLRFINANVANAGQAGFQQVNPDGIQLRFSDTGSGGYCPRNFWIGPSDVIRWYPKTSAYNPPVGKGFGTVIYTQTLIYSFTCITET